MNKIFKTFSILLIFSFLLTTGVSCGSGGGEPVSLEPVTLDYWGVWHDPDDISQLISDYRAMYPYVTINYRQFRFEEYERELLEAFAEDRGPDIFSIHNTWVNNYIPKATPLPTRIRVARKIVEGEIRKRETIITEEILPITTKDVNTVFPEVVAQDVIWPVTVGDTTQERIMGLPLYLDTMVLFYNRDLLNNANIPQPPQNWEDFIDQVQALTQKDTDNNILIAGAALGTAGNVTRYFDIVSLLMMQNGTPMVTGNTVTFDENPRDLGLPAPPGAQALDFYTSFAQIDQGVYTWNDDMPNSLDAFIAGQTAFFFGYSYHIPIIESRAPKLNFDISGMPQVFEQNRTNYANYWVETVSKKSKNPSHAWNLIRFMTTEPEEAKKYTESANRPTALRSVINEQLADPDLDIFADQILTAQSWYRGKDSNAAEEIFKDIINDVLEGEKVSDAIDLGAERVNRTWR